MHVIPVIDIRGGAAVAAVRGDRARYRPLESRLAVSADPVAVALGLRTLFPFPTLYVADLDGIEGRGADIGTQRRLAEAWPGAELWIDDALSEMPPANKVSSVIGSESLSGAGEYERVQRTAGASAILSLDFRGDDFVGPRELLDNTALWPDRLIVMTLVRVGSGEGPDLTRLKPIIGRAAGRKIYAAGGVRHLDDLKALRTIGAAGALVATALHTGQIETGDLEEIAGESF